jgi:hypothetical protein
MYKFHRECSKSALSEDADKPDDIKDAPPSEKL